jgi:hypothetical protein
MRPSRHTQAIVQQRLLVVDVDQPERGAAAHLGDVEEIADVEVGEARPRAEGRRNVEPASGNARQGGEIEIEIGAEIVELAKSVALTTHRVSLNVHHEGEAGGDAALLERRPQSVPVSEHVLGIQQARAPVR